MMKDLGIDLESVAIADLGQCKKVHVTSDNTTLVEGAGSTGEIQGRIAQIRNEIDATTSDYDREKLEERLAKLAGGVAQVNVGASTETDMKEKKARIEDALHATRAAIEEGIVAGGGVALLRCKSALDNVRITGADEKTGVGIVRKALEAPIRAIARNAGFEPGVVVSKVEAKSGAFGFNAATLQYGDLVKDGVIDPTKVVRSALENGSSVARIVLSTDCIVTEKPKDDDDEGMPPGEDMDMM
jgi:chaperonin GroEL